VEQEPHKQQATSHAYREDTRKKAPKRPFLGTGSALPGLNKDDLPSWPCHPWRSADMTDLRNPK
jgi:hypothetical protein